MEPMGPGRRSLIRRKRPPAEEEETPFPAAGSSSRRHRWGAAFLLLASLPLLLLVLYFVAFFAHGRSLVHERLYDPGLFKEVVDGKGMDEVLEFLGPPTRVGPDGDVRRWIYEPGAFDLVLVPYLPWSTPVMNGKVVYDAALQRSPRRILIGFGQDPSPDPGNRGTPRSRNRSGGAAVAFEY